MTDPHTTNLTLPTELVRRFEVEAQKAGMSLESYLTMLARVIQRGHDGQFLDAAKQLFGQYPDALRRLAE